MPNARAVALKILLKIEQENAYSNLELLYSEAIKALDRRDTAFVSRLVYGVLERKITLDHRIQQHCTRKLKSLSPEVLQILRIAVYQIFYMDRVPDSAAVNEAVNLTKKNCRSASGFVNGVLRSILRATKELTFSPKANHITRLSVTYSVHPALVKMLLDAYGTETTVSFLESSFEQPPVHLRVNNTKTSVQELSELLTQKEIEINRHPILENCIQISNAYDLTRDVLFEKGLFHVQDCASQYCCLALDPKPHERILDVCAAPGGKTFTIAERMDNLGEIVSCDIHSHRVALIQNGADRLGLSCVKPTLRDACNPDPSIGQFDRVLCDVPCSGFGVIRRKPEIRYRDPDEFADLIPLQKTILEISASFVKPGGILVYSTCTLNPKENTHQVEMFLKHHRDFAPIPVFEQKQDSSKTFFTHLDQTDGFFVAKLIRKK